MANRDIVVIGGSAGGLEAMCQVVAGLPADLPASVLLVLHMPPDARSAAADVLSRCGPMTAATARDGEPIVPGRIYVPVPDRHLLVHDGSIRLSRAPQQNRSRPAVDALFRSAARWYGPRTVGLVLSGALDDGAAGLATIVQLGGVALVQDPADAVYAGMPQAALAVTPGAEAAAAWALSAALIRLVGEPVPAAGEAPDPDLVTEVEMAISERPTVSGSTFPGRPVGIGCPDCGGGMHVLGAAPAIHYLCHIGHSWSPYTLLAAQHDKVEQALWTAVSMLEEQAHVHRHLAERAAAGAAGRTVRHQLDAAEEILAAASVIRKHFPELLPEGYHEE
ncbi:chemotaxis protein CheB [Dactylosporangium sp. CS-033363]|uniref:chemotaxis protein CheB n=1 Tax=Dactylosporangium sp. CS-033363 TaxID=3239935 RepID=UPI003D923160